MGLRRAIVEIVTRVRQAVGMRDAVTYIRIDRVALMTSPGRLDAAESSVRAFLASRPTLTADPKGQMESSPEEMEEVRLNVAAAISDLDWIDGYRRGLADAERASRGATLVGPGATPDPKDGWSPSVQRSDAYNAGLGGVESRVRICEQSDGTWWAECLVCAQWVSGANATRRTAEQKFGRHLQNDHLILPQ